MLGLDVVSRRRMGSYSRPRRLEIASCLNRIRGLKVDQKNRS